MPLKNDGDPVRGLGFVTLYAAYVEEQTDILLFVLQPVEAFPEREQCWPISKKIKKAKRLVEQLAFEYRDALLADLDASKALFEQRNEVIHGRIYANFDRPIKWTPLSRQISIEFKMVLAWLQQIGAAPCFYL